MHSRPSFALLAALAACVVAAGGCGTRYARQVLYDREGTRSVLRAELVDGAAVDRGYAHPATISGVRLAHILSRIDVRFAADKEGGQRKPAIATGLLYELGDLLSEALSRADSSQEVVIQAVRKERNLGIFTNSYYTSFVGYVRGEDLVLHLSRVDDLLAKGEEDELREPVTGREVMAFKVLPAEGIVPVAHQAVAVDWRNPVFRSPTNVRVGPGGTVVRRTILMESAEPEDAAETPRDRALPDEPAILRALADLEEARRNGAVTELEYQQRRRDLLRGAEPE